MENMTTETEIDYQYTTKVLLDTNILIYGWDSSSPFNEAMRKFLDSLGEFYIADRSLLEFYRAYTGPLKQSLDSTMNIIKYYLKSKQCHILSSSPLDTELTFELAENHNARSGKIFDLNILAMAIENDINILYTKNIQDYPQTPLLQLIDPTI
jgi:predicted nucleic acid-binding protein